MGLSFLLRDRDHFVQDSSDHRPRFIPETFDERPRFVLAVRLDSSNVVYRYDTVVTPFPLLGRFDSFGIVLEYFLNVWDSLLNRFFV